MRNCSENMCDLIEVELGKVSADSNPHLRIPHPEGIMRKRGLTSQILH